MVRAGATEELASSAQCETPALVKRTIPGWSNRQIRKRKISINFRDKILADSAFEVCIQHYFIQTTSLYVLVYKCSFSNHEYRQFMPTNSFSHLSQTFVENHITEKALRVDAMMCQIIIWKNIPENRQNFGHIKGKDSYLWRELRIQRSYISPNWNPSVWNMSKVPQFLASY